MVYKDEIEQLYRDALYYSFIRKGLTEFEAKIKVSRIFI